MQARVLIALVLFALQVFFKLNSNGQFWTIWLCTAYLIATAAALRWSNPTNDDSAWSSRWIWTLWLDLGVFALLQLLHQGGINYTPLVILPVLTASVLGSLLLALGSAAGASLIFLFDAWLQDLQTPNASTTHYLQGAISGAGAFLVAWLAHELALRLAREQEQALMHQRFAEIQTKVSQLIVNGLNEGVVVVDPKGQVLHANAAARCMVGLNSSTQDNDIAHSTGGSLLNRWAVQCLSSGVEDEIDLTLLIPEGEDRRVHARARLTPNTGQQVCVVFMEDLHDIETRVRNEKLAAMGRVSAAVAHEIRNPLAAISQASALLAEDTRNNPLQQRLTAMIGQNARRLGRTVDDILDAVKLPHPLEHTEPLPTLALNTTVAAVLADWQQQRPQGGRLCWQPAEGEITVTFDPEHLRRVMLNLLDNADRHASQQDAAICVQACTQPATGVQLTVWSDGAELEGEVRKHLFEPFVSSYSRSSGLGLYISRELCLRYQADLIYERTSRQGRDGNAFTVLWQV